MQSAHDPIAAYVDAHIQAARSLPVAEIERILDLLRRARDEDRTLFVLGNGGSATTATHLVCDFAKNPLNPNGPRLRALALTDSLGILTAWANDHGYETVFAEQLRTLVRPGDLVMAISGSGNSTNVLRAVELARHYGAITIGLTGFDGGKLRALVDYAIVVPSTNMQVIEDIHLMLIHLWTTCLNQPTPPARAPSAVP